MTSKKAAKSKRAVLPRSSDYTKEFLADWQRLSRSGRYDMGKLKEVMMLWFNTLVFSSSNLADCSSRV